MKKYKGLIMRLIPMVLLVMITVSLSEVFFQNMIDDRTEGCWEELSTAQSEAVRVISTRFNTNITVLNLASDAIMMNTDLEDEATVLEYLSDVQSKTIFNRIDVIFPNGTILVQSGERVEDNGDKTYNELLAKGSHISQRTRDFHTGKEAIHVFAPVYDDSGNSVAILGGTIYCSRLADIFTSATYGDKAQLFLIDRRDGNYVLDKWHDTLGNINDSNSGKPTEEYKNIDYLDGIMNGHSGHGEFISETNGKVSYMSYAPVPDTEFSLLLSVQDDVVFNDVNALKHTLTIVGIIELILLLIFTLWIYFVIKNSMKNETRAKEAELELIKQKDKELQHQVQKVEDKNSFFEAIAKNLPGGYHRCNTDDGFSLSYVSDSFLEITGYTKKELKDKFNNRYINIVAPEDREYFMSLEPELQKNGRINCTYRIVRGDGSIRWIQDATQRLERDGQSYYQCALLDIHDFVNELNEAKKEAEESSVAKSTFLFNASHDIRTPMNAITGFAHIIDQNFDNPKLVKETIGKVIQSGKTLMTLLDDVLELSRIERGKDELNLEKVNLGNYGKNLYEMFADAMEKSGINFKTRNNISHTNVLCDPVKLSRIGMNFLSNARKFTPKGGTVIFGVEEIQWNKTTATYRFYCRDTGIGMSKDFVERAFDQFERERTATESGVTGSGLGLSITKKIVELMGGDVSIASELGKGTEISAALTFTLVDEDFEKEKMEAIKAVDMTGKHVLLVEDNDFNREIAKYILEDMKFKVDEAENGLLCVDMLLKDNAPHYDLILMDLQMPVMDGYKATEEIRNIKNKTISSVPIIAMTANAFEEDKKKCLEVGMNGHIGKPIDPEKLIEELTKILSEQE